MKTYDFLNTDKTCQIKEVTRISVIKIKGEIVSLFCKKMRAMWKSRYFKCDEPFSAPP